MPDIYKQLEHLADALATAYTINETAFAEYKRAEQAWIKRKDDETGKCKAKTGKAWDASREEIVKAAQCLMPSLTDVLAALPSDRHASLRRQAGYLKEAFDDEKRAYDRYANCRGGNAVIRQEWQDARGEISSRARPLIVHIRALVAPIFESQTPTEVGK